MVPGSLLLALLSSLPMPGEAEFKRFDDAFERGEALYSKGDYGAAISLFREADRLKVTPEVAFDLARSYEKLGDKAFTTLYDRLYLVRAREASDAPDVAIRIERTLMNAEEDGRGFVEVFSPGAQSLTVAGKFFPAPPAALFLPPGEYVVEGVFASGTKKLKVEVSTGRPTSVWFEPVRPPMIAAGASAPTEAVKVARPAEPTEGPPLGRIMSFVSFGVGAAALGTGAVMGVLSNADASRAANKDLTVREARIAAEAANGKATAANVLFVAGGVAVAAGAAFFVLSLPEPGATK